MQRAARYRLYPTRAQERELERQLGVLREVWNAALEQRRWAWRACGASVGFREQSAQLTEARRELPQLASMNALAQHQVLRRLYRRIAKPLGDQAALLDDDCLERSAR